MIAVKTEYLSLHPAPVNVKKFAVFHEMMKKKGLRGIVWVKNAGFEPGGRLPDSPWLGS